MAVLLAPQPARRHQWGRDRGDPPRADRAAGRIASRPDCSPSRSRRHHRAGWGAAARGRAPEEGQESAPQKDSPSPERNDAVGATPASPLLQSYRFLRRGLLALSRGVGLRERGHVEGGVRGLVGVLAAERARAPGEAPRFAAIAARPLGQPPRAARRVEGPLADRPHRTGSEARAFPAPVARPAGRPVPRWQLEALRKRERAAVRVPQTVPRMDERPHHRRPDRGSRPSGPPGRLVRDGPG